MRFLIIGVSVSAMALATGAFAQTRPQSPPAAVPGGTGLGMADDQKAHPNWFTEPNTYKPCPSSVVFPDGRPACLGCPAPCRWRFREH